jgi:hypothetical protein
VLGVAAHIPRFSGRLVWHYSPGATGIASVMGSEIQAFCVNMAGFLIGHNHRQLIARPFHIIST